MFSPQFLGPKLLGFLLMLAANSTLEAQTTVRKPVDASSRAEVSVEQPMGGWTAKQAGADFMQEVHYPANRVNLPQSSSTASQIRGQIRQHPKGKPALLVVNGTPMPLEVDEAGHFARPWAFSSGSNSVEVRAAGAKAGQRVQTYDASTTGARARLRVVLSWDSAGTDMDLHVISPSGQHCFYGNRVITGGGALDVDVTTGYGPEIFGTPRPEPGVWHVYVNYFGGMGEGKSLSLAQVAVITDEGTLRETRRVYRVPLRSAGDLQHVASFSVI